MFASKKRILVGMSGGVDSSYAAALLKEQGYDVVGAMLNLWTEPSRAEENRCCSIGAQHLARRVAAQLDIPFYVIDAKEEFRRCIVDQFISDYVNGLTPNPCVACNAQIRWKILLEQASKLGIDTIATGHYARIGISNNGRPLLYKGLDSNKDQSYMLSMVKSNDLSKTILPLGEITKEEVRKNSQMLNLPSSNQPDSQDLCFLGGMDYREFLAKYAGKSIKAGEIINENGEIVGKHDGLPYYTIGQRKGLRIANNPTYYISQKNPFLNQITISSKFEPFSQSFNVKNINWLTDISYTEPFSCTVKIRYRSNGLNAKVTSTPDNLAKVNIEDTIKADVTPGQIAVFYQKDLCLGGGIIV